MSFQPSERIEMEQVHPFDPLMSADLISFQIRQLLSQLVNQYKSKETEFNDFVREHKIRVGPPR